MMDPVMALGLTVAAAGDSATLGPCILLACCRSATDGLLRGLLVTLGIAASKTLLLATSWGVILGMVGIGEAAQVSDAPHGLAMVAGP